MIRVKVEKSQGSYASFECTGHAGYAEEGEDIVCSAVSALVVTAMNSLEAFTDEAFSASDRDGHVKAVFHEKNTPEGRLLMDSLLLGLDGISEEYPKYLKIQIREV